MKTLLMMIYMLCCQVQRSLEPCCLKYCRTALQRWKKASLQATKLWFSWIFAHADIGLALPPCTRASLQLSTLDLMNSPLICLLGPSDWEAPSCCKHSSRVFCRAWLQNFRLTSFPKLLPEVQWLGFQLSGSVHLKWSSSQDVLK